MSVCNYEPFWIMTWYFSMHYWFAKSSKYIFKQHLRRFEDVSFVPTDVCVREYYKYLLHRRAGISELAYSKGYTWEREREQACRERHRKTDKLIKCISLITFLKRKCLICRNVSTVIYNNTLHRPPKVLRPEGRNGQLAGLL